MVASKRESRVTLGDDQKARLNVAIVIEQTLSEIVTVKENGKAKTITKLEAAAKCLAEKAMAGDVYAFRVLSTLIHVSEEVARPTSAELEDADKKILQRLARQMANCD